MALSDLSFLINKQKVHHLAEFFLCAITNIYENRSEKLLKIYPKPALVCMPAKCSIYPIQKIVISLEDKDFLLGPMA